jgi:hypothetical protein
MSTVIPDITMSIAEFVTVMSTVVVCEGDTI